MLHPIQQMAVCAYPCCISSRICIDIVLGICSTYVDAATAAARNLTFASANAFVLRADHTTMLTASGPGRNSVRLKSKAQYRDHVAVYVNCFMLSYRHETHILIELAST